MPIFSSGGGSGGGGTGSHAFKTGSGVANYTTTSTTFTPIDDTNLKITATVPLGSIAWALFVGSTIAPAGANTRIGLVVDGTAAAEVLVGSSAFNLAFSVQHMLVGDAASHTWSPQYYIDSGHTATILNNQDSSGRNINVPMLALLIVPAT